MARSGVCRLTGDFGPFVKSHLLPQSLTRPTEPGTKFIEGGLGRRLKRVPTSWYDDALVTRKGENILSRYDDAGVRELRSLKLIWRSWGPMTEIPAHEITWFGNSSHGIRELRCKDPSAIRLLILSILWRFVETSLSAFNNITMSAQDKSRLLNLVSSGVDEDPDFYPITLLQIAKLGPHHNLGPIMQEEYIDLGGGATWLQATYRFYFDGLVAHVHRPHEKQTKVADAPALFVGSGDRLLVQTQGLDGSLQMINQINHLRYAWEDQPDFAKRFGLPGGAFFGSQVDI